MNAEGTPFGEGEGTNEKEQMRKRRNMCEHGRIA